MTPSTPANRVPTRPMRMLRTVPRSVAAITRPLGDGYTRAMSLPVVAIVGRPNVGKSTLFNRLVGERVAIVEDIPGTTRDRVYGIGEWNGRRFTLVDTGGLELDARHHIEERVQDQARVAIEEADLVLFVVDAAAGIAPLDHEVADRLRRAGKPTILVVNKADNPRLEHEGAEFYALGFGTDHRRQRSARPQHRRPGRHARRRRCRRPSRARRSRRHRSMTTATWPRATWPSWPRPRWDRRASRSWGARTPASRTFVNRVLGEERMIVSDIPGTTRDPVDSAVMVDGEPMILVDTAGIRRRGSVDRGIERYSVLRAMKAIERADVAVVMTDAIEGYTAQDAHVVGHVLEAGKGIVLVINKWDALEKDGHTADDVAEDAAPRGAVPGLGRHRLRLRPDRAARGSHPARGASRGRGALPAHPDRRAEPGRHRRGAGAPAGARPQPAAEDPVRDPGGGRRRPPSSSSSTTRS